MLFRQRALDGIRGGTITLAFRRWRRSSVRAGGTLLTPVGQLTIAAVTPVTLDGISAGDARRAGYESVEDLVGDLRAIPSGQVYRIELGPLRPDPRVALRDAASLTEAERRALAARLRRLDARSTDGPWVWRTLTLIGSHAGVRTGDLCRLAGQEQARFKRRVRTLKAMGLTESLGTGYRLSPRGARFLDGEGVPGG